MPRYSKGEAVEAIRDLVYDSETIIERGRHGTVYYDQGPSTNQVSVKFVNDRFKQYRNVLSVDIMRR